MKKLKFFIFLPVLCLLLLFCFIYDNADAKQSYDISQYQGNITNRQAHNLRHEVNFTILRAEYGGQYQDIKFNHNAYEMTAHHIPYGVYDYSLYANGRQAKAEADALYRRAPQAKFYVNDSEENHAGRDLNRSTYDWASEIHRLTTKPAVLYSDESFMNRFNNQTRNHYDALWLAAYGRYQPSPGYRYDLWQYTDNHYSRALDKRLDASIFPNGWIKKLSFWIGNYKIYHHRHTHIYKRHSNKSFDISVNGKRFMLLRSHYRIGSYRGARKSGFRRGPRLGNLHTMFNKYSPNSRKAIIPRDYRIIQNNTVWLVHRYTRNVTKINHIKYAYYYSNQYHGWVNIGY